MKTSIIIPSYNQSAYLRESIESALGQTHASEIIVIDDGSTDDSLSIAHSFGVRGVKVISQVNKGLAAARNAGIMNATGEYILPLDADDILLPTCVAKLLRVAEETDADITAPSFQTIGLAYEQVILKRDVSIDDMRVANHLPYFSLFKKTALLEFGGYSSRMDTGYEDYHLEIGLILRGKKVVTVPEVLVLYRTKKESMWHEAKKDHDRLMNQIYKDFPQFLPHA